MTQPWNGSERRACGDIVSRRTRVRAAWPDVRVESLDYDAPDGDAPDGAVRAWVRLGELAPADVVVELVRRPNRGCRMWCEQSYHNGSFVYATGTACVADDVGDGPETWMVRITAARLWAGALDLPPVVGGGARITSGSGPARAPAARIRCGA